MHEPDYSMKIMATNGGLLVCPEQADTHQTYQENGETKKMSF